MSIASRRRPYPWLAEVDGTPLMLRADEAGQFVETDVRKLEGVVPSSYDIGSYPPFVEKEVVLGRLTGGMGQKYEVPNGANDRYYYAVRVDLSIGGVARKGPEITWATVNAGQRVNYITSGVHAGAEIPFALVGNTVYRFSAGAWVLSDTGAPLSNFMQAVSFQGTAGNPYLFVTTDGGALRAYDGAVWAAAALPVGAWASFVEKVGDQLVIGSGGLTNRNEIRVASADPMLAGSWGGPTYVGDASRRITWLRAVDDQLFVFKEDGVFSTRDGSGGGTEDVDLTPELRAFAAFGTDNGRHASAWRTPSGQGAIYHAYGGRSFRITGGDTSVNEPVGLARLVENDSEVAGQQTAFAGDQFFGWYAVYNEVTGDSYLVKHGTWVNTQDGAASGYAFNDVPNGAVAKVAGEKITALAVLYTPGPNPRLYIGTASGKVGYVVLPRNSPDPAADANCRFETVAELYYRLPIHTGGFPGDVKHFRAFGLDAPGPYPATANITVDFRTDPTAAYTPLGTALTQSGQRVGAPGNVTGKTLDVKVTLSDLNTSTPVVSGLVVYEQLQPDAIAAFDFTAVARTGAPKLDGTADRRTAEQVLAALRATSAKKGYVSCLFPDGSTRDADVAVLGVSQAPNGAAYGRAWDVKLRAVQFRTTADAGP